MAGSLHTKSCVLHDLPLLQCEEFNCSEIGYLRLIANPWFTEGNKKE